MKNKKDIKGKLNHYTVPRIEEKDILKTISIGYKAMDNKAYKTSLAQLIQEQIRYISFYLWAMQLIAITVTVIFAFNITRPYSEVQQLVFSLSPLIGFLGVPELIKHNLYGMGELEYTCKNSGVKLLVIRLFIIGSLNLVSLTIISSFIYFQHSIPLTQTLIYGLVPFNMINALNLFVYEFFRVRSSNVILSISFVSIIVLNKIAELPFFFTISQTMWMIMFLGTTMFLGFEVYYLLKALKKEAYV
ncbi:hypothetical protein EDC19_1370 [Natranaerovirga hydrolytica]|uniref:ABC-2 family transporter n=1 Tax=Natranaerovirga hydrolytica TaxID=680378 RepID=A0A4V2Q0C6_9FIRM|nr:hypothetical protein [Natranaerovirga hydrolytica]TCK93181.1 hypothetical protein EDC19_1370 [Natranaerovirga hydrolytica]